MRLRKICERLGNRRRQIERDTTFRLGKILVRERGDDTQPKDMETYLEGVKGKRESQIERNTTSGLGKIIE